MRSFETVLVGAVIMILSIVMIGSCASSCEEQQRQENWVELQPQTQTIPVQTQPVYVQQDDNGSMVNGMMMGWMLGQTFGGTTHTIVREYHRDQYGSYPRGGYYSSPTYDRNQYTQTRNQYRTNPTAYRTQTRQAATRPAPVRPSATPARSTPATNRVTAPATNTNRVTPPRNTNTPSASPSTNSRPSAAPARTNSTYRSRSSYGSGRSSGGSRSFGGGRRGR